jgi:hypothetical protein
VDPGESSKVEFLHEKIYFMQEIGKKKHAYEGTKAF